METYLDRIVASKREELRARRAEMPLARLEERLAGVPRPRGFAAALRGVGVRIIAEVKRASPSRGALKLEMDPVEQSLLYARNGGAAISVLTEAQHFKGSIDYLSAIREKLDAVELGIPLLRKDFIFDRYQVVEARAYGADALLLIVAILSDAQLRDLMELATQLGMDCLVEVHSHEEIVRALDCGASVVGINNRDLHSFQVDLATSLRLRPLIPDGVTVVSESGIRGAADLMALGHQGVHAALIGEALVTDVDPAARLREFVRATA